MKILLFPRILAKTGVGNHVKQLSEELCRQGHSVTVVSSTKELDLDENVEFIKLDADSKNPLRIGRVIMDLHKIIEERNIEIVHCHHRKASLIMRLYNIFYRMPFVYTSHLAKIPNNFIYRKMTFVGERAIAVSGEVSESLINDLKISGEKIVQISNGVNPIHPLTEEQVERQKAEWGIAPDKYVLAMHSRIDSVKNHLLMVNAISKLSDEAKRKIVVICSGRKEGPYYTEVRDKIQQLVLDDMFKFVGWTNTVNILGIADFLFLPSLNEGFALSVAEAFMLGVPVARTKTAGFEEQKYCLPIDAYDPNPVVDIIEDLVKNGKEQYNERIEKSRELAFNEFTVETMTQRTVDVYKGVCNK